MVKQLNGLKKLMSSRFTGFPRLSKWLYVTERKLAMERKETHVQMTVCHPLTPISPKFSLKLKKWHLA